MSARCRECGAPPPEGGICIGHFHALLLLESEVAADPVEVSPEVTDMVINRVLDNASVAMASVNRAPIVSARDQALRHRPAEGRPSRYPLCSAPEKLNTQASTDPSLP